MDKFTTFTGLVAPLNQSNVDTDSIIPSHYLKSIKRTGFGPGLFEAWRYLDSGGGSGSDPGKRRPNPDFVLNQPRYQDAEILLTGDNFGCGSSREHAPWALLEYGFRALIGPSFADIFYHNSLKNGLLPVVIDRNAIDRLFKDAAAKTDYRLTVDLAAQTITAPGGEVYSFEISPFRKHCLLNGLDDIGVTLQQVDDIRAYEARRKNEAPWLFS